MDNEKWNEEKRKKRKAELSLQLFDLLDIVFRTANGIIDGFAVFILKNDRIKEKFKVITSIIEPFETFPIAAQEELDEELEKIYNQFDTLVNELTSFCQYLKQKYEGEGV